MTITDVRAPDYSRLPVPENESSDEFHDRWKLDYEAYKFMMGWHNPADFNPSRSRSERDRASELSRDLLNALTGEFRYEYFKMDPKMRKIVSGLPDVWFKLLCHRGCTGKPSDQGRSINRALDLLNFHELDTLLDVNPNSEVPVAIQVQRNFVLCSADAEQWNKWYTEIGDPHFKSSTCEICGESPISQDTAGINKMLSRVKQENWRQQVNRIGWHEVGVRVNTLTAWVFRQMILSRRFKIREIKRTITQVSETDGSDGQVREGIEEKRFSPGWNAIKANQLSVRRNNFLSDDMSALSLPKLLITGVVRTEITSFAACTNERHKGYSPDQRWFEDIVRDMGTKYDRVLGTNQWKQVERQCHSPRISSPFEPRWPSATVWTLSTARTTGQKYSTMTPTTHTLDGESS
jgi:hypothetical protein